MLRARGDEHVKAYVASLRAKGLTVVDRSVERALTEERFAVTLTAMASGADVIVQAPLGDIPGAHCDICWRRAATGAEKTST